MNLYKEEVDSKFGPVTEDAIKRLQRLLGVTVDGIVGRETEGAMKKPKHDEIVEESGDKANFKEDKLSYFIGRTPLTLDRGLLEKEVA